VVCERHQFDAQTAATNAKPDIGIILDCLAHVVTETAAETVALGARLARELRGVVLLIGDLGAGKTTLVKGIAAGLEAAREEEVSSPTFTLIHEYGDPVRVYHIDLYRLETEREVESLGLEELWAKDRLVLIEWGERFPRLMPLPRTEITITAREDDSRIIEWRERTE
jgi:tRNA threonylcarbamoyladenosine biosynthesis protein TsaE